MSNLRAARDTLLEVSRRYSRVGHEVEDLAHDIILSSLRRHATLDADSLVRSAHGAARRHGAFLARGAMRRKAREARYAEARAVDGDVSAIGGTVDHDRWTLPLALQTTLLLLLMELQKAELRVALGISDAALRKRFQALRARSPLPRPHLPVPARTPVLNQLRRAQVGLLPRLLDTPLGDRRLVAVSDPDGHGLIFAQRLTPGVRTATTAASVTCGRARRKGKSCSTLKSRISRSSSS